MSEFRSAATDFAALRKRKEELFGEPWHGPATGTENGVATGKITYWIGGVDDPNAPPPPADPGHYPGY